MLQILPSFFLRLIAFLLLQVLVINHIDYISWLNAMPYIFVLLALPFDLPAIGVLVLGFVTGLTMDFLTGSYGIHTSACTTLAFIRPLLIVGLANKDVLQYEIRPTVYSMGLPRFGLYVFLGTLFHHFNLYLLEFFNIARIVDIGIRTSANSVFTTVFIVLIAFLIQSKDLRNKHEEFIPR